MNRNAMRKDDGKSQRKLVKVKLSRDSTVRGYEGHGIIPAGTVLKGLTEVHAKELELAGTAVLYETKVIQPELKQGAAVVSVVNETPPPQPFGALTLSDKEILRKSREDNQRRIDAMFPATTAKTEKKRGISRRGGGKRKG